MAAMRAAQWAEMLADMWVAVMVEWLVGRKDVTMVDSWVDDWADEMAARSESKMVVQTVASKVDQWVDMKVVPRVQMWVDMRAAWSVFSTAELKVVQMAALTDAMLAVALVFQKELRMASL